MLVRSYSVDILDQKNVSLKPFRYLIRIGRFFLDCSLRSGGGLTLSLTDVPKQKFAEWCRLQCK